MAFWEGEEALAAVYGVTVRTLYEWRERGCPYHRDADGGLWYPMPHAAMWRTFWLEVSRGLRDQVGDIPLECALAHQRLLNARAEYMGLDEFGRPFPGDIQAIPPAVPRWRPNDWTRREFPARGGRFSYVGDQ